MKVTIDNLSKIFGDVVGVENLTLHIDDGEFVHSWVPPVAARQPRC